MLGQSLGTQSNLEDRSFIVTRVELNFNYKRAQLICFTDITAYQLIEQKEEEKRILLALNTTVHHEMLAPLKATMDISMHLYNSIKKKELKKMAELIFMTTQMIFLHA